MPLVSTLVFHCLLEEDEESHVSPTLGKFTELQQQHYI